MRRDPYVGPGKEGVPEFWPAHLGVLQRGFTSSSNLQKKFQPQSPDDSQLMLNSLLYQSSLPNLRQSLMSSSGRKKNNGLSAVGRRLTCPSLEDYEQRFKNRVREADFFKFCVEVLEKNSKRWRDSKGNVQKYMSSQKENLENSLTRLDPANEKKFDDIWRALLKVAGLRNSRYPSHFHQETVLTICMGRDRLGYQAGQQQVPQSVRSKQSPGEGEGLEEAASLSLTQSVNLQNRRVERKPFERVSGAAVFQRLEGYLSSSATGPPDLRAELYLQLVKLLYKNGNRKSVKGLLEFFELCLYQLVPQEKLVLPLLNFFLANFGDQRDAQLQENFLFVFERLSVIHQSYEVIRLVNSRQLGRSMLSSLRVLKTDARLEELVNSQGEVVFESAYHYFSQVTARRTVFSPEESQLLASRVQPQVKVHLMSESSLEVEVGWSTSVRELKAEVLARVGLSDLQPYMGILRSRQFEGSRH